MNILITGGAGFIGTNLIKYLNEDPTFNISVLDNESLGKKECLSGLDCSFIHGDILNNADLDKALHNIDAVVHLAADTRVMDSIENPTFNFQNNVVGSFNLLQRMKERGINKFVCASTGGAIIGDTTPPVHEKMLPHPASPYGASKLALEGYCSAFHQSYGMACTALRFSNVYGPYSFHKGSVVAAFIRNIQAGIPITVYGDGEQTRDFIFSFDLAGGIKKALLSDNLAEVIQLGSGRGTSLNQLISILKDVIGNQSNFEVIYKDYRNGEVKHTHCDISKARSVLGFNPTTPLAEGIKMTWQWFQDNKI